jgi:hypothetical protein
MAQKQSSPWPGLDEYASAVQNPHLCFADPSLQKGKPTLNKLGIPHGPAGNFAVVYQINSISGKWAVRCFSRRITDQAHRYSLLTQYLPNLNLAALTGFEYKVQGILIKGIWYPVIKMEWIEGIELQTFAERNLQNPGAFATLAFEFRKVIQALRRNRIAHGDLQHGNILVTPQMQLRLVDYDAMLVPALKGTKSPELGERNYQHPMRSENDYDENLDNFSALVIYSSFFALSIDQSLWRYHIDNSLIFNADDYKDPARSRAFNELKQSKDPHMRALVTALVDSCQTPLTHVPELEALITALPTSTVTAYQVTPKTVPRKNIPKAPYSLTVSITFQTRITLAWSHLADGLEDGFMIERRSAGNNYLEIARVRPGQNMYEDKTALPGNSYVYRLAAFNNIGNSNCSNEVAITVPANLVKCPQCGLKNASEDVFCQGCLTQLVSSAPCPKCARMTPILAKFCTRCGHRR